MIKKLLFMCFGALFACCANADVDMGLVTNAEKYLNSITGLSGKFVQTANNKTEQGIFAMLRPGRVRLDYDNMPVQLISDGTDLYFFDRSLDQITTVPLTSTPAGILIRKNIDLKNADINVAETQDNDKTFQLKLITFVFINCSTLTRHRTASSSLRTIRNCVSTYTYQVCD